MRIPLTIALFLFCNAASAAGMSAIPRRTEFCANKDDAICYEWRLTSNPSIRLVAHGDEDGVEYSFYKLKDGSYEHLVRIHPVIKDAAHHDTYFWGYAWDIDDIVLAPNRKAFMATFEHSLIDDGEVHSPAWQKRVPAVLFIGHTTQAGMKVPLLHFEPSSLKRLASKSGG